MQNTSVQKCLESFRKGNPFGLFLQMRRLPTFWMVCLPIRVSMSVFCSDVNLTLHPAYTLNVLQGIIAAIRSQEREVEPTRGPSRGAHPAQPRGPPAPPEGPPGPAQGPCPAEARPSPGRDFWKFGNLEMRDPKNRKNINSQNQNPFCSKCRQGLDLW